VNPSSFEAFEGIRILLPGALVVAIYGAVVATFAPATASPTSDALTAVAAALFVGLTLLFIDAPAKSAAYRSPDLPSWELERWGIDARPYKGNVNLYLVMLDVSFPPMIRNRGLYTGAMFRIGFEGIYLVGLAVIGVFFTEALFPHVGQARDVAPATTRDVLFGVVAAHVAIFSWSLAAWYSHRRQRARGVRKAWAAVRTDLVSDLEPGTLFLLVVAGALLGRFITTHESFTGVNAVALPTLAWAILFFWGRAQHGNKQQPRRPITPPSGGLLYGTACAFAAAAAAVRVGPASAMGVPAALSWGAASLVPALLIATRGHERKLIGSFRTQTTWMRINRSALMIAHDLAPDPQAGP
jgi:hypothetical protein